MIYMEWQIMDMKSPLPDNIRAALEYHEKKYGKVPNLIEHGMKIDPPKVDAVRYQRISIPENILLLAVE